MRATVLFCALALSRLAASEEPVFVPDPHEFAPVGKAVYLSGELVVLDPVNRRGGLRLDGDDEGRYHTGPLHYFAMLPYGEVSFNGAPAELRDIPLGAHVHGYFFAPPKGEEGVIPPLPEDQAKFELPHNHAIRIEDDFSFYTRQGRAWKVESLDLENGKLDVVPRPAAAADADGIRGPYRFDVDEVTRVWTGSQVVGLDAVDQGAEVQLNLEWSQGSRDHEFTVRDLWLDDESRAFATERQRRKHLRYQRQRWVPGWVDSVEPNDYGGGELTLTLFGGVDPKLHEELKAQQDEGFGVACANKTLRTWFHRADKLIGKVLEWRETPNPPVGSSGIQVRMKFEALLAGYEPGACVRVKAHDWRFVTMPPEERLNSLEELERAETLRLP